MYNEIIIHIMSAVCGLSCKLYDDLDDNSEFFSKFINLYVYPSSYDYIKETARILFLITLTYCSMHYNIFAGCGSLMFLLQYFIKYKKINSNGDETTHYGEGFDKAYEYMGMIIMIVMTILFQIFDLSKNPIQISKSPIIILIFAGAFYISNFVASNDGQEEYSYKKFKTRGTFAMVLLIILAANKYFSFVGTGIDLVLVTTISYSLLSCLMQWIQLRYSSEILTDDTKVSNTLNDSQEKEETKE